MWTNIWGFHKLWIRYSRRQISIQVITWCFIRSQKRSFTYRVHLTSGSFYSTLNKAGQAIIQEQFNQLIQLKDQWALVVVCLSKNHDSHYWSDFSEPLTGLHPNCAAGHIGWFVGTVHLWARSDASSVMLWFLSLTYFKWMCLCVQICVGNAERASFSSSRGTSESIPRPPSIYAKLLKTKE